MKLSRSSDIAWAAGIFEGEGCVSTSGGVPQLFVSMCDKDVVDRFASIVGGSIMPKQDQRPGRLAQWRWSASGRKIIPIVEMLLPNLGLRRTAKAREALSMANNLRTHRGKCKEGDGCAITAD